MNPLVLALSSVVFFPLAQAQKPAAKPASAPAPAAAASKPASKPASAEEAEMRKKGLVKIEDHWVPKEDVAFLKQGLVRVDGEWVTKEEKAKLDAGWKRQDGAWVSPEEVPNLAKGLFKIEGKWVDAAAADEYHSKADTPWIVVTPHFTITSTVKRSEIGRLTQFAESTYDILAKVCGMQPKQKLNLRLFNGQEEANEYGQQFGEDHSSVWPGYVAHRDGDKPGVALYDGEAGKGFAHLFIAHAAAHKFIDETIPEADKLPTWFVEGLATYCDRFARADIKKWALENLVRRGGFDKIEGDYKKFKINVDDVERSQKYLFEGGLLFAYLVEAPDKSDDAVFKKAIAAMQDPKTREDAIRKILANPQELEKRVRKFGGI